MTAETMTSTCGRCGAPVARDARFCHRCGAATGVSAAAPAQATLTTQSQWRNSGDLLPWTVAIVAALALVLLLAVRAMIQ